MKFQVLAAASALAATTMMGAEATIKLIQRVGTWECDLSTPQDCAVVGPLATGWTMGNATYGTLYGNEAVRHVAWGAAIAGAPAPSQPALGAAYGVWQVLQAHTNDQSILDYTDVEGYAALSMGNGCTGAFSTDDGQADNLASDDAATARYVPGRYSGICGGCYQTYGTVCTTDSPAVPELCDDMELANTALMLPTTDTVFSYDCDDSSYTEYIFPAATGATEHLSCADDEPASLTPGSYAITRPVDVCVFDFLRTAQAFSSTSTGLLQASAAATCGPAIGGVLLTPGPVASVSDLIGAFAAEAPTPGAAQGAAFQNLQEQFARVEAGGYDCFSSDPNVVNGLFSIERVQKYTFVEKEQGEVASIVTYVDTDCDSSSSTSIWNTDECNYSAGSSFIVQCAYSDTAAAWVGTLTYYTDEDCDDQAAEIISTDGACKTNPLADTVDEELWRKKISVICDLDASWTAPTAAPSEEESGVSTTTTSMVAIASAAVLSFVYSMI